MHVYVPTGLRYAFGCLDSGADVNGLQYGICCETSDGVVFYWSEGDGCV